MHRSDPNYRAALAVARTLRDAGHQAFFAGGCVRDLLLGLAPKDYDVATSAHPSEITRLFAKTRTVGAHFGVVLVCGQIDGEGIQTEVATFRHDGAYSDGRRPDAVRFSTSPEEDVVRRDFTINGLLLDPFLFDATGDAVAATLDFVHGREDLAAGIVRAIGSPDLRFSEDKLRMLRAIRFAARLEFQLDPATAFAIRRQAAEIHCVSAERVRDELTRILTGGHADRGFELLYETGLLAQALPEVVRLRGVAQPPEFHPEGDVWTHTMLLLQKLESARVPHPSRLRAMGGTHTPAPPSTPPNPFPPRSHGARCCTTSANPPPTSRPTPQSQATASASTATSRPACASPKSSSTASASPTKILSRSLPSSRTTCASVTSAT